MNTRIPSLPSSPCKSDHPFLPNSQMKTLFITIFETIIHASVNTPPGEYDFALDLPTEEKISTLYVTLRPGLNEFLQAAKKACFEIVTFTWHPRGYVSQILDRIDPTGEIITHQLFNDYCFETRNRKTVMDLTLTGRMVDRSVIIDNNPESRVKQWCNAIKVNPFTGDANDVELWRLFRFFEAQGSFIDVRNLVHVSSEYSPMPCLPLPPTTRKTLFLDLDNTLIHKVKPTDQYDFATKTDHYIIKRPGVEKLLQVATDNDFEIVIFTAGHSNYASPIIDWLDPNGLIAHRLYRNSCKRKPREIRIKDLSLTGRKTQEIPIKDLSLTGRSLDRCIIIDDLWQRVPQRENVVMIKPFKGGAQDSELTRLLRFFEMERRYEDLRDAVSHVNVSFRRLNL